MFGWDRAAMALASRWKRASAVASWARRSGSTLTATSRSRRGSRGREDLAMAARTKEAQDLERPRLLADGKGKGGGSWGKLGRGAGETRSGRLSDRTAAPARAQTKKGRNGKEYHRPPDEDWD